MIRRGGSVLDPVILPAGAGAGAGGGGAASGAGTSAGAGSDDDEHDAVDINSDDAVADVGDGASGSRRRKDQEDPITSGYERYHLYHRSIRIGIRM